MTGDIVPRSRGWQVTLLTPAPGGPPTLRIAGEVELGNKNEIPRLVPSEPASLDPSCLALDLAVVIKGPSELTMHWAALEFRGTVPEALPEIVRIIWMGVEVAALTTPVSR